MTTKSMTYNCRYIGADVPSATRPARRAVLVQHLTYLAHSTDRLVDVVRQIDMQKPSSGGA